MHVICHAVQCKASLPSLNKRHPPSDSIKRRSWFTSCLTFLSPVLSALLHSSCCWLPVGYTSSHTLILPTLTALMTINLIQTLLDLTSIGSASAAAFSHLRPVFSAVTLLILLDSIRRQGLNRHNVLRILVSGLVLILPTALGYYQQPVTTDPSRESCH